MNQNNIGSSGDDKQLASSSSSTVTDGHQSSKTVHKFTLKDLNITKVRVYFDRAEVTREIEVERLEPGEQSVVIEEVTKDIMTNTFKVTGQGSGVVLETSHREKEEEVKNDSTERKRIEEELKTMQFQLLNCQQSLGRIAESKKFVENFAKNLSQAAHLSSAKRKVAQIEDLISKEATNNVTTFLGSYSDQLEKLDDELLVLKKQEKQLKKQETMLKLELSKQKPEKQKEIRREAHILVLGSQFGKAKFTISYMTMMASWEAFYDIRVNSNEETCELIYFANVRQQTQDVWQNVQLSLSTSLPSERHSPPELNPILLGYKEPIRTFAEKSRGRLRKAAPQMSHAYAERRDGNVEMEVQTAKSKQGATSSTFEIEKPSKISNNNQAHKITIAIVKFRNPRFEYYTVPKVSDKVFLRVNLVNNESFPFLKGDLNVFVDGSFVTTSSMKQISPGEKFDSYLNTDEGIKAEYKPPQEFRKTTGLLGGTSNLCVSKVIKLKCNKSTNVMIKVKDHLPTISDEQITLAILEPSGINMKENKVLEKVNISQEKSSKVVDKISIDNYGKITWELKLAPGERVEIPLKYELSYPSDRSIYNAL